MSGQNLQNHPEEGNRVQRQERDKLIRDNEHDSRTPGIDCGLVL